MQEHRPMSELTVANLKLHNMLNQQKVPEQQSALLEIQYEDLEDKSPVLMLSDRAVLVPLPWPPEAMPALPVPPSFSIGLQQGGAAPQQAETESTLLPAAGTTLGAVIPKPSGKIRNKKMATPALSSDNFLPQEKLTEFKDRLQALEDRLPPILQERLRAMDEPRQYPASLAPHNQSQYEGLEDRSKAIFLPDSAWSPQATLSLPVAPSLSGVSQQGTAPQPHADNELDSLDMTLRGVIQSVDMTKGTLVLSQDGGHVLSFSDVDAQTLKECQAVLDKAKNSHPNVLAHVVISPSSDRLKFVFKPGLTPAPDGRKNLPPSQPSQSSARLPPAFGLTM